jgi:hypothetical protein
VVPVTWAAEEELEILHPRLKVNAKHPKATLCIN